MKRIKIAAVAFVLSCAPALAQSQSDLGGLVNVNLQDVLNNLAADIKVDKSNIPVTAQIPVSVAANVCGVSVNVLSQQASTGQANCTAKTGSQQLTQVVQQQMSAGGGATSASGGSTASGDKSGNPAPTGSTAGGTSGSTAPKANTADKASSGGTVPATGTTADAPKKTGEQVDTTGSLKGNANASRSLAPGQRCDGSAKDCAPGQQADPQAAAPGQLKKQ